MHFFLEQSFPKKPFLQSHPPVDLLHIPFTHLISHLCSEQSSLIHACSQWQTPRDEHIPCPLNCLGQARTLHCAPAHSPTHLHFPAALSHDPYSPQGTGQSANSHASPLKGWKHLHCPLMHSPRLLHRRGHTFLAQSSPSNPFIHLHFPEA